MAQINKIKKEEEIKHNKDKKFNSQLHFGSVFVDRTV